MIKKQNWKPSWAVTFFLLVSMFSTSSGLGAALQEPGSLPAPSAPTRIYLPFVTTGGSSSGIEPANYGVFGVETSYIDSTLVSKADGVDTSWWRHFAFSWGGIGPNDLS